MSKISFDQVRQAANTKHAEVTVDMGEGQEPVVLLPYLRLSPEQRRTWDHRDDPDVVEARKSSDDELKSYQHEMIVTIAKTPRDADRLIEAIGDNVALGQEIILSYAAAAASGEAEPSQS